MPSNPNGYGSKPCYPGEYQNNRNMNVPAKKTLCYICTLYRWQNVGKTMPFLPPMTGNGNHTTYKNGDFSGGWCRWHCFTHILPVLIHPHKGFQRHQGMCCEIRTTALSDCARYSERRKDGILARFVGKTMPESIPQSSPF